MKRKTEISLILTLLMIVSTFAFSPVNADGCEHPGQVDFVKKVWDNELNDWVDEVEAELGETLRFKLEVTYHMDEFYNENPLSLYNITIADDWDWEAYCFEYVEGSATVTPTEIVEDGILWELDDVVLQDNDSYSIEFELLIVDLDCEFLVNVNWASVTATECGLYEHEEWDNAVINLKSGLYLEKQVWDPELQEWVDDLPQVTLCNNVKFRITATYYGCNTMKCMVIADLLPDECFEYLQTNIVKIAGDTISPSDPRYPDIYSEEDDTITVCDEEIVLSDIVNYVGDQVIFWDWRDADFNLHNSESVQIEFEVDVVQYCGCEVTNYAVGILWGCHLCDPCNYFLDCDSTTVTCNHPPTTFEKKIKNPDTGEWVEEIQTFKDEIVRFQLKYTYYGNEEYNDTRIVDHLPCILEYANNANIPETYVSDDKKTIWWNLTDTIKDCDTITIEFDALVTDVTGGCPDCAAINYATLYVYEEINCQDVLVDDYTDTASLTSDDNCDPYVKYIAGPTEGDTGDLLKFKAKGDDQCDSDLQYWFDWGDGTNSGWVGPYTANTEITQKNSWDSPGIYTVKVKVKDEHDAESDWSEPALSVNITPGEPDVQIAFKTKFGIKSITATVVNKLATELKDAFVEIRVEGGLLTKMDTTLNWTKNLTSGDNPFPFKQFKILPMFGKLNVHVNVTIPGYTESFEATAQATKIGPIVIVK